MKILSYFPKDDVDLQLLYQPYDHCGVQDESSKEALHCVLHSELSTHQPNPVIICRI